MVTLAARRALAALQDGGGRASRQPTRLPALVTAMWISWSIVLPVSWVITFVNWTLLQPVWRPETFGQIDAIGVFEHFGNTLIITGEFLVSRNAFSARNIVWGIALAAIYIAWSLIHGVAKVGVPEELACDEYPVRECPIYPILDWNHPVNASVSLMGALVLWVAVHMAFCRFTSARDRADR